MKDQSGEVFHTCISANFPFSDIGSTEMVAGKGSLMENYKKKFFQSGYVNSKSVSYVLSVAPCPTGDWRSQSGGGPVP